MFNAKVAQLVEHNVANVRVVGSNPIFRSKAHFYYILKGGSFLKASYPSGKGSVCKTAMHQFESGRRLNKDFLLSFFNRNKKSIDFILLESSNNQIANPAKFIGSIPCSNFSYTHNYQFYSKKNKLTRKNGI